MVARDFSPWIPNESNPLPFFRPEGGRSAMGAPRRPSGPKNNKEGEDGKEPSPGAESPWQRTLALRAKATPRWRLGL